MESICTDHDIHTYLHDERIKRKIICNKNPILIPDSRKGMSKECSKISLVKSLSAECRGQITGMYVRIMGAESVCCNRRVYHYVSALSMWVTLSAVSITYQLNRSASSVHSTLAYILCSTQTPGQGRIKTRRFAYNTTS